MIWFMNMAFLIKLWTIFAVKFQFRLCEIYSFEILQEKKLLKSHSYHAFCYSSCQKVSFLTLKGPKSASFSLKVEFFGQPKAFRSNCKKRVCDPAKSRQWKMRLSDYCPMHLMKLQLPILYFCYEHRSRKVFNRVMKWSVLRFSKFSAYFFKFFRPF